MKHPIITLAALGMLLAAAAGGYFWGKHVRQPATQILASSAATARTALY